MSTRPAGDRVMRVGIAITVVGLLVTVVAIVPLVAPSVSLPGALWFLSMLTGVGLVVILVGLAMGSRSRRQSRRPRPQ